MNVLLFTLLFVLLNAQYKPEFLNDFSGDVDIYDMGVMGRGKNAASWHRSLSKKQEVFYYLAMQPWRHLVWTDCTGTECYKYIINEDASSIPSSTSPKDKLPISSANDYCRKEYAHPMATFDIDWSKIESSSRLESIDINGVTCFKYPAKLPLAHIYLQQHYTQSTDVASMTPCRYEFVGGKSITFRSFNEFSDVFIGSTQPNGYLYNKTRCNIDPSPNNVDTDLAIVLGISDNNVRQQVYESLSSLGQLTKVVKQIKAYYMSGNSVKKEVITDLSTLKAKQVSAGSVDALINTAKNELIQRINSKAIYRGTLVVLMDRALASTFDAETAFDRNQITVYPIVYNPNGNNQMSQRAQALLSLGEHYFEFKSPSEASAIGKSLFVGVRANLTERCNRTSCNGFCDGRDRCTCPMCCENTCYFSYCDAATATCKSWPEGAPKEKIHCANDCVGDQVCEDLVGCKYTRYNDGCEPPAKCMKPFCNEQGKCDLQDTCEKDKTPSFENKCWSYSCDITTGKCVRVAHGNECPQLTNLCDELVCDSDLKCSAKPKTCVKTSPYIEMGCYIAKCNKKTGKCENALSCDTYSACGKTASAEACTCNADKNFECHCTSTEGYCNEDEVCDATDERENNPECIKSDCGQDLYRDGCRIKRCNKDTKLVYWEELDCSKKVVFEFKDTSDEKNQPKRGKIEPTKDELAKRYCSDKVETYCDEGECYGRMIPGVSMRGGCGTCELQNTYRTSNGIKTYTVNYIENCGDLYPKCPNGKNSTTLSNNFDLTQPLATCEEENDQYKCVYKTPENPVDYCAGCYTTTSCYKSPLYSYTYNAETGTCNRIINDYQIPQCSKCNVDNDAFERSCVDVHLDRTYNYKAYGNSKTFKYQIPKVCSYDQCIPDPDFNCGSPRIESYKHRMKDITPEVQKILSSLEQCYENVKGTYHYSSAFVDDNYYVVGMKQDSSILSGLDSEAYCVFTYEQKMCHECTLKGDNMEDVDKCKEESNKLGGLLNFVCNDQGKCIVEKNVIPEDEKSEHKESDTPKPEESEEEEIDCPLLDEECYYHGISTVDGKRACVKLEKYGSLCDDNKDLLNSKKAAYINLPEKVFPEIECSSTIECNVDKMECPLEISSDKCKQAYQDFINGVRDFGCKIPKETCDESIIHCVYEPMVNISQDIAANLKRDGVRDDHACYEYTCQETCYNGQCTHKWVQTPESLAKTTKTPASACEEVVCDDKTGEVITSIKECLVSRDFKQIDEAKAECFKCQCSALTGEMVLVMLPDTETQTYELDGCGNCIIRSKETGEQINKPAECILDVPVNLTGAIAGATVAASIVFGLIGSMVVVAVGALQTYQLVSSAMKNVISTTLENPEFVAADNEATNALAAD